MRFVSFFAGMGGLDLGLERSGHTCVGQVEIDPYCLKVLAKHWPAVPKWGDIRELKPEEIPESDLWTAGFPCQDISNAGKRAGIKGQRSGLYFDLMRLAAEVRPRYILLENVAALINRGLDTVLGTLAESGYDAEWACVPAAAVGAPHIRDRVFILAYPKGHLRGTRWHDGFYSLDRARQTLADSTRMGRTTWCGEPGHEEKARRGWHKFEAGCEDVAYRDSAREAQSADAICPRWDSTHESCWWFTEPPVGRVVHGLPGAVDRREALGKAVVPQVAEYIGRLLKEIENVE